MNRYEEAYKNCMKLYFKYFFSSLIDIARELLDFGIGDSFGTLSMIPVAFYKVNKNLFSLPLYHFFLLVIVF